MADLAQRSLRDERILASDEARLTSARPKIYRPRKENLVHFSKIKIEFLFQMCCL